MNDLTPDPEISSALNDLPSAPAHGAGFWDELSTSLSAQASETPDNVIPFGRRHIARYSAIAAAAAAVVFAAALGIAGLGGDDGLVDSVTDSTVPETLVTTTAPATTTSVTTTSTAPPTSTTGTRDSLVGTAIDQDWTVLYESAVADGSYVSRPVEQVDCGAKDIAFATNGVITQDYGRMFGAFEFAPGPQGALTMVSTCSGTFNEMRIGAELGGPAESFALLELSPRPIVLENVAWNVVEKFMVGTAIFDTTPTQVRINSGTGVVTVVDETTTYPERAASELFHYDVGVPEQFEVDYATGRGVSLSDVGQSFDAGLQVSNYFVGDTSFTNITEPYADETSVGQRNLTIPLLENNQGEITDRGVILEILEVTYSGGFSENRIVRVYRFNDRTVVAELRYRNGVLDVDPIAILDDIRMFNAAFDPPAQCSSFGLPSLAPPAQLNPAQSETFVQIVDALVTCNWDQLDVLTPDDFTASFGGTDPLELWMDSENYSEGILATLYDHLTLIASIDEQGGVYWPQAHNKFPDEITDAMRDELLTIGYDESNFEFWDEIGYIGHRTGIDADGTWSYFVAGD